jgi:glucose-1-phosphate cytidylyltransferase
MLTYGDGVANIDLAGLLRCHEKEGRLATVTAVHPSSRYGELAIRDSKVELFREKPQTTEGWINGGFFAFNPAVLDLIEDDADVLETGLLSRLAERGELAVYQHDGFWQCMDTYRETQFLNELWERGAAPWKIWT